MKELRLTLIGTHNFTSSTKRQNVNRLQHMPVLSIDTNRCENVGNYKNPGREYRKKGQPRFVTAYDFTGELGKVAPYGIYDVLRYKGWVNVGLSHDTAEFAVMSHRLWFHYIFNTDYPDARKIFLDL